MVKGWYTIPNTDVAAWRMLGRQSRLDLCASQAKNDVNFNNFAGVVVLTNQTGFSEDLFGSGGPTTIAGTGYPNLGQMVAEEDQVLNGITHETGHALGLNHSRALSRQVAGSQQVDYGDLYDMMSCLGCYGTPAFLDVNGISKQGNGGPGLNVVQLATAGWLPADRGLRSFDNSSCNQTTIPMAALNHPEAPGYLEARSRRRFRSWYLVRTQPTPTTTPSSCGRSPGSTPGYRIQSR